MFCISVNNPNMPHVCCLSNHVYSNTCSHSVVYFKQPLPSACMYLQVTKGKDPDPGSGSEDPDLYLK